MGDYKLKEIKLTYQPIEMDFYVDHSLQRNCTKYIKQLKKEELDIWCYWRIIYFLDAMYFQICRSYVF